MRINRNTLILLVISVVVIVAALALTSNPASAPGENGTPTPTSEAVAGPLFPELTDAATVTRLEIRDNAEAGGFTVMNRGEGDTWTLETSTLNPDAGVDAAKIAENIDRFIKLESADGFASEDLAQFGLDAPAYTITATTSDDQTFTLHIGGQNAGQTRFYALLNDDKSTVYILQKANPNTLIGLIAAPPYIVATPEPQLAQPIVPGAAFPGQSSFNFTTLELRQQENDEFLRIAQQELAWVINEATYQQDAEVDQTAAGALASSFANLQVRDSFVVEDLAEFGLDAPLYTFSAATADGSILRIQVGGLAPGDARYYALINDDTTTVYLVERASIETLAAAIQSPPYLPVEITPEATAEMTPEATPEATAESE